MPHGAASCLDCDRAGVVLDRRDPAGAARGVRPIEVTCHDPEVTRPITWRGSFVRNYAAGERQPARGPRGGGARGGGVRHLAASSGMDPLGASPLCLFSK